MVYQHLLSLLIIILSISATQAQNTIDDYLRLEQDHFILYAPNKAELEQGQEKLTYATQKFSTYFSKYPPKISVLLPENPSDLQNLDLSELRSESAHFMPFLTESYLNNQTQNATNVFALNMGAILIENNGNVEVAAVIENANKLKIDIRSKDIISSINGKEISTLQEFKKMYNSINVNDRISLKIKRDGTLREITFLKHLGDRLPNISSIQTSQKQSSPAKFDSRTRRPLTHEACHAYFIAFVDHEFPNLPKSTKENGYGSDAMPDWLDESAATLCEISELQNARKQFLLQNIEDRYSLGELFTMAHPLETLTVANKDKKQTGFKVLRLEAGEHIKLKLGMFYSQVQSIANFLVDRTNPFIMREITEHYAQNIGGMSIFLKNQPDLPNTIEALEKEWLEWL